MIHLLFSEINKNLCSINKIQIDLIYFIFLSIISKIIVKISLKLNYLKFKKKNYLIEIVEIQNTKKIIFILK